MNSKQRRELFQVRLSKINQNRIGLKALKELNDDILTHANNTGNEALKTKCLQTLENEIAHWENNMTGSEEFAKAKEAVGSDINKI